LIVWINEEKWNIESIAPKAIGRQYRIDHTGNKIKTDESIESVVPDQVLPGMEAID